MIEIIRLFRIIILPNLSLGHGGSSMTICGILFLHFRNGGKKIKKVVKRKKLILF